MRGCYTKPVEPGWGGAPGQHDAVERLFSYSHPNTQPACVPAAPLCRSRTRVRVSYLPVRATSLAISFSRRISLEHYAIAFADVLFDLRGSRPGFRHRLAPPPCRSVLAQLPPPPQDDALPTISTKSGAGRWSVVVRPASFVVAYTAPCYTIYQTIARIPIMYGGYQNLWQPPIPPL